jgi:hypothetical protein
MDRKPVSATLGIFGDRGVHCCAGSVHLSGNGGKVAGFMKFPEPEVLQLLPKRNLSLARRIDEDYGFNLTVLVAMTEHKLYFKSSVELSNGFLHRTYSFSPLNVEDRA